MRKRKVKSNMETIPFDDERMSYYYKPWERSLTNDGPVIKSQTYNDYVDIWHVKLAHLQWWSEKAPSHGVAGFKIWGPDWEIQELLSLYSPTKESKIEVIKTWNFPLNVYTITLLNTGEKDYRAIGVDLVHAYFKISLEPGPEWIKPPDEWWPPTPPLPEVEPFK